MPNGGSTIEVSYWSQSGKFVVCGIILLGHSRKHPYHPHGGNWKFSPPYPFGCPNTFPIYLKQFFLPSPSGR